MTDRYVDVEMTLNGRSTLNSVFGSASLRDVTTLYDFLRQLRENNKYTQKCSRRIEWKKCREKLLAQNRQQWHDVKSDAGSFHMLTPKTGGPSALPQWDEKRYTDRRLEEAGKVICSYVTFQKLAAYGDLAYILYLSSHIMSRTLRERGSVAPL